MPGTLYIIGLGLCNESDITLSGLNAVKASHRVFLEHYTSILSIGHERLAAFYGKDVELAGREVVESESDRILDATQSGDVSFLVVGDPGAKADDLIFLRAYLPSAFVANSNSPCSIHSIAPFA